MPNVTVIPAKIDRFSKGKISDKSKKKRVCAYARVSTDYDEQLSSYEAQVAYYTEFIKEHKEWVFVNVYSDEGISGLQTKHRIGFKAMIDDAKKGKIDLIITKSISRFARNTVDTLQTIRDLKSCGVEVFFEKENIHTFDSKGELLLTIMSSLSQEESRSISENVTWGERKRMQDGKMIIPFSSFLGYERDKNGKAKIVSEEAETVRLIYRLFLSGYSYGKISKYLESNGILSPMKKTKWHVSTVKSILTNEKYTGKAILQKNFTVDFLTKKVKKNEGELPKYEVKDSHEGIISEDDFNRVQAEIMNRKSKGSHFSSKNPLSSKIICGDCGGYFGRKVWHSKDKYRRIIWRCNRKYENNTTCRTPFITEEDIKNKFVYEFNEHLQNKDDIIQSYEEIKIKVFSTEEIDEKLKELNLKFDNSKEELNKIIKLSTIYSDNFDEKYIANLTK